MINFFSNTAEYTSNLIFQYLQYFNTGVKINRFNSEDIIKQFSFEFFDNEVILDFETNNEKKFNSRHSSTEFVRRYHLNFKELRTDYSLKKIKNFSFEEIQEIIDFFLNFSPSTPNSFSNGVRDFSSDKLTQLKIASNCGLLIPNSIITNSKKRLIKFWEENNERIIIKPVTNHIGFKFREGLYQSTGTQFFTEEDIKELSDTFFPTLFQKYTHKEYEVRIFFFLDNFWSMAIFSQLNKKTKIDYRNYDENKSNRMVPYKISHSLKSKLKSIKDILGYNSGSIDLIYNASEGYVFLEINPSGQFGMVSHPCNYYIERYLAKHLINEERK